MAFLIVGRRRDNAVLSRRTELCSLPLPFLRVRGHDYPFGILLRTADGAGDIDVERGQGCAEEKFQSGAEARY
jgi:hypothetical protein